MIFEYSSGSVYSYKDQPSSQYAEGRPPDEVLFRGKSNAALRSTLTHHLKLGSSAGSKWT